MLVLIQPLIRIPSVLTPNEPSVRKRSREKTSRGRQGDTVQSTTVEAMLVNTTCAMIAQAPKPASAKNRANIAPTMVAAMLRNSRLLKLISLVSNAVWVCPSDENRKLMESTANNG